MAPTVSYKCQTPGSPLDLSLKPTPQSTAILFDSLPPLAFTLVLSPSSLAWTSALSLSTAPLDNQREPVMTLESDHTKAKVLNYYQFTWTNSVFGQSCSSRTVFLAAPPISVSDMLQPQGLCVGCALCLEYSPRCPSHSLLSFSYLLKCLLSERSLTTLISTPPPVPPSSLPCYTFSMTFITT